MPPVMLVILDGFGIAPKGPGNAVALANTPNFDKYWQKYPHSQLEASGKAVGLPAGQMGNSEVGHMNLGAGRIVMQSLSFIQDKIDNGEFFENEVLRAAYDNAKDKALHIMGLVSDGGVHSDLEHLLALLEFAKKENLSKVYIHIFTDGRDVSPKSAVSYIEKINAKIKELDSPIKIATVIGRYYAMDRDNRWERVKTAYDAIVCAKAKYSASSATEAVEMAYARGETDEFIKATTIANGAAINDGDSIVFINFRADRARQLSYALLADENWQEFERCKVLANIHYVSMMEYDKEMHQPFAFALPDITKPLAEVISDAAKTQYHTAETEKYPHVTFFFNAKREKPYQGESRKIVPSPQDVATYDLKPEMSAKELTKATLERIENYDDDFILINYANPDMVGHTGVIPAAIKACEAADEGLGQIVEAVKAKGGVSLILADHGNAEKMLNQDGSVHTAHTTNPVPFIITKPGLKIADGGVLGDVAVVVLELMGLNKPKEMTGKSLIK